MKNIIIAIDGPAGSGKSSSARVVAETLKYIYIDTGAMYRAVTLAWMREGTELTEENVYKVLDKLKVGLKQSSSGQRTFVNEEDVSDDIRLPEVTRLVSPVSAMELVRTKMVEQQREMGANGGIVMDGRDIGTIVFPQAELKVFLIASIEARAERRGLELRNKGFEVDIENLKTEISERDRYDSSREISPLRKAADALEIDTSNLTIQEQTQIIINLAKQIIES
ncbi:MAG: (d)CMP kinase [Candidatus Kapabacteria bacterium]|nr:(d)CMP kinase [Candidatus Kapabacteria bacterium]